MEVIGIKEKLDGHLGECGPSWPVRVGSGASLKVSGYGVYLSVAKALPGSKSKGLQAWAPPLHSPLLISSLEILLPSLVLSK